MVLGFILFAVAGFAFGYLVPGKAAFLPLIIPIILLFVTIVADSPSGSLFVRFVVGLAVTLLGIVAGRMVARARGEEPVSASES